MSFGTGVVLVTLIICVTILIAVYIVYCGEQEVGIFENRGRKYDNQLEKITSEIKEIKEWIKNSTEKDNRQGD